MIHALEFPCGMRPGNFGDRLTCHVLRQEGVPCMPAGVEDPHGFRNLLGIGSVLQLAGPDFEGAIWTTGVMHCHQHATLPAAKVLAVRGLLTYERLTCQEKQAVILGDGALLVTSQETEKQHELGVVPHWSQMNTSGIVSLANQPGVKVINPCDHPGAVIDEIAKCKQVASSSLHGIVVADALGVPNIWINPDLSGGINTFKFWDYYSAFMRRQPARHDVIPETTAEELISKCEYSEEKRHVLAEVKQRLRLTVDLLKEHFGG